MINYFSRTISLHNLKAGRPSGQIATILILIMVAVLIFILVTVNLGNISLTATKMSNVADSSVLYLASQLATRANFLSENLRRNCGNPLECCTKGGLLGSLLAIVFAVVAIIVAPYLGPLIGAIATTTIGGVTVATGSAAIAAGAIAGAIGGAIGGAIVYGTAGGALQGAVQGLATGAAIGSAFSLLVAGPGGATVGTGQATIGTITETTLSDISAGGFIPFGAEVLSGSTVLSSYALGAAALTGSASLYNEYINDKRTAAAFETLARGLSGLPEYDRMREGIFLQAFSQIIDDPKTIPDEFDYDGDGDLTEKVPYFYYWWEMRTRQLLSIVPQLRELTNNFFSGPAANFRKFIERQYSVIEPQPILGAGSGNVGGNAAGQTSVVGALCRSGVEGRDGVIVELWRGLYKFYPQEVATFWEPGPSAAQLAQWEYADCNQESGCAVPPGYDQLDDLITDFKNIVTEIDVLRGKGTDALTSTWQTWIREFYDPDSQDDDYDTLGAIIQRLEGWKAYIVPKRNSLAQCQYQFASVGGLYPVGAPNFQQNGIIINPPCQDGEFATVDRDYTNEFSLALDAIDSIILQLGNMRNNMQDYYSNMTDTYAQMHTDYGGVNPATYQWTDSRGEHSLSAQVGPFRLARVITKKSGNFLKKKTCLKLVDYYDSGLRTWIKINRKDPANQEVGSIGKWSPYDNDDPHDPDDSDNDAKFSLTRISRAYYSYNAVGIANRR